MVWAVLNQTHHTLNRTKAPHSTTYPVNPHLHRLHPLVDCPRVGGVAGAEGRHGGVRAGCVVTLMPWYRRIAAAALAYACARALRIFRAYDLI